MFDTEEILRRFAFHPATPVTGLLHDEWRRFERTLNERYPLSQAPVRMFYPIAALLAAPAGPFALLIPLAFPWPTSELS